MTVGDMRELTRQRVVSEEIVPQNVVGLLMDEDAEPPELDAFTFLTRLRALGIGSADFLYLLEGCEAPRSAVDKVKANPAMNLQSLILTLESSGLTAEDYSAMLYTARQIWERTLTLRLEKSEMVSQNGYAEENSDYSEPTVAELLEEVSGETDEAYDDEDDENELFTVNISKDDPVMTVSEAEDIPDEQDPPEPGAVEDTHEEQDQPEAEQTEIVNPGMISAQTELSQADGASDEPDPPEAVEAPEAYADSEPSAAVSDDVPDEDLPENADEDIKLVSVSPEYETPSEEAAEEAPVPVPYNGDTTAIIQIDSEMLKQNLARLAEEQERSGSEAPEQPENAKEPEPDASENKPRFDEPERSVYHKGAIITAAAGAAVLFGASAAVGAFAGRPETKTIDYAKISNDIFDMIYYSYYPDDIPGAGMASPYTPDYQTLFGDLLVNSGGFGSYSDGENVYSVTEEAISSKVFKNGSLTEKDDILPPDGTHFAAVFDNDGALLAVFGGKQECGYMSISGGSVLYTVRQDGFLTDFALENGSIMLGSVYTPHFSRSFTAEDTDVYLPAAGTEKTVMPVEKVAISGTKGYSYAVSACYSVGDGSTSSIYAALGDPVFASADGRFIMRGEEEDLLIRTGETLLAAKTERVSCGAFFKNGCAVGGNGTVSLLSDDFTLVSRITNIPPSVTSAASPTALRFNGNILLIYNDQGLCRAADCTDIKKPSMIQLTEVNGTANSENALIPSADDKSAKLTYYSLENGSAKEIYTYTKALSAEELSTLKFGGTDTVVLDGTRCGAAFSYFDGVSVISDYAVMSAESRKTTVKELFDDKTGFTLAFKSGGGIYAVCGNGTVDTAK